MTDTMPELADELVNIALHLERFVSAENRTGRRLRDIADKLRALAAQRDERQEPWHLVDGVPRCRACGYSHEDCQTHMDHRLCQLPDPPPAAEGWEGHFARFPGDE